MKQDTGITIKTIQNDLHLNNLYLSIFYNSIDFQERFLVTSPLESDTHEYKWWVPITFAAAGDNFNETFPKVWMKESEHELVVKELPNKDQAVIFNIQQTGRIY